MRGSGAPASSAAIHSPGKRTSSSQSLPMLASVMGTDGLEPMEPLTQDPLLRLDSHGSTGALPASQPSSGCVASARSIPSGNSARSSVGWQSTTSKHASCKDCTVKSTSLCPCTLKCTPHCHFLYDNRKPKIYSQELLRRVYGRMKECSMQQ